MKCELCHQNEAEKAIVIAQAGEERELYVCRGCAREERVKRQKKSQRTRKGAGSLPPGVSISVTRIGGALDKPPPIIEAIMNAVSGIVGGSPANGDARPAAKRGASDEERGAKEPEMHDFPCSCVEAAYRFGDALHLEGLFLIGEIPAVQRALKALEMQLVGFTLDGVQDAGHVYRVRYSGSVERAKRVVSDLLREERNARNRIVDESPRLMGDAICRALAVLKNCRMLARGELFDLLSPLRLAAMEGMLEGVKRRDIERRMAEIDLKAPDGEIPDDERDRMDAECADEMNRSFEDVVLSERGEERFL